MRYKYKKTGKIYELINIANECNTEKFPKMAVYFSTTDGKVYVRPFNDFMNAFIFIGGNK